MKAGRHDPLVLLPRALEVQEVDLCPGDHDGPPRPVGQLETIDHQVLDALRKRALLARAGGHEAQLADRYVLALDLIHASQAQRTSHRVGHRIHQPYQWLNEAADHEHGHRRKGGGRRHVAQGEGLGQQLAENDGEERDDDEAQGESASGKEPVGNILRKLSHRDDQQGAHRRLTDPAQQQVGHGDADLDGANRAGRAGLQPLHGPGRAGPPAPTPHGRDLLRANRDDRVLRGNEERVECDKQRDG